MSDAKMHFSKKELARYARHFAIPEFGMEAQLKLKEAKVLVIGAGGLGSPLLLYLAAAGVGHIGIVDFDRVDDSNLQRQVLYTVDDVGVSKAIRAKERLVELNPHIKITAYNMPLGTDNALALFEQYDIVADGTDNFPTRYLVNDACVLTGKVNVYASIFRFEGQVSVFNYPDQHGERGPNYRDLFPEPPPPGMVPSCAEGGVLGVLPGIIGSLQANEVIKVITGVGEPLSGRLFLFDAASFTTRTLQVVKRPDTTIEKLINYEQFCGIVPNSSIETISVEEFKDWQIAKKKIQLIDVRESHEHEAFNVGGEWIPLGQIEAAVSRIAKDRPVVIYCQSGNRSAQAIERLRTLQPFENLLNLEGGMKAWINLEGRQND